MVDQDNDSALNKVVEILNEYGSEGFADALTLVLNAAMVVQRERFLGAKSHERSETRRGYANGFKSKTIKSVRARGGNGWALPCGGYQSKWLWG